MAEVAAAAEARGCSEAPDGVRRPRGDPARPGPASRGARGSVRFVPGLLGLGGRGTAQPGGGGAEAGAVAAQVPRAPHEAGARRWGGGSAAGRGGRGRPRAGPGVGTHAQPAPAAASTRGFGGWSLTRLQSFVNRFVPRTRLAS